MDDQITLIEREGKTLQVHCSHDGDVYAAILEGVKHTQIEFPSCFNGGGSFHWQTQQAFREKFGGEKSRKGASPRTTGKVFTGEITKRSDRGCSLTLVAQPNEGFVLKIVGLDYQERRVVAQMEFGPQDELKDWFTQLAGAIEEDNEAARENKEGRFQSPEREK